jgi:hypothetical protein
VVHPTGAILLFPAAFPTETSDTLPMATKPVRRCFISAPASAPVGHLVSALGRRGWDPYVLTDVVQLGESVASAVVRAIRDSDAVVAVLSEDWSSANAAIEAGMALALDKRLLLIASPGVKLPTDLADLPSVHADADNVDAIEFALGLLDREPRRSSRLHLETSGGGVSDDLLAQLQIPMTEAAIVGVLAEAIQASGGMVVSTSAPDRGFDLGVWSDDLGTIGANPLLVEVKRHVDGRSLWNVLNSLRQSNSARVGLIVHLEPIDQTLKELHWPILSIALPELAHRLAEESFAEIVRDLRNRSVHGTS